MIWVMLIPWHSTSILARDGGNGDRDPSSLNKDAREMGNIVLKMGEHE